MPLVAIAIISGVGLALDVIGNIKAGNAAARAGESEAQRDEFNAGVADLQAGDAITRGQDEESRFRTQVRGLIGTQRAGFAGQGVDVGSGSAADVQADSAYLGELDAQTIRANAQREAWGYQVEAEDRRKAAAIARAGGKAAQTASRFAAASEAATGTSSLLLTKYSWGRNAPKAPGPSPMPPSYPGGHP